MTLRNCAQYALFNYFIALNDFKTAYSVRDQYHTSKWVAMDGGAPMSLFPLIIHDLTKGKYQAHVTIKQQQLPEDNTEDLTSLLDLDNDKIASARQQCSDKVIYSENLEFDFPSILMTYRRGVPKSGHLILMKNKSFYESNQWTERCVRFPDDLPGEIFGTIKITKAPFSLFGLQIY